MQRAWQIMTSKNSKTRKTTKTLKHAIRFLNKTGFCWVVTSFFNWNILDLWLWLVGLEWDCWDLITRHVWCDMVLQYTIPLIPVKYNILKDLYLLLLFKILSKTFWIRVLSSVVIQLYTKCIPGLILFNDLIWLTQIDCH